MVNHLRKTRLNIKSFPIHPVFFSIFNVVYYFMGTSWSQGKWELIIACLLTILGTFIVWWLANKFLKNRIKSAIVASLILILSFHLDGIYEFLINIKWMPYSFNIFLTRLIGQYILYFSLILIVVLVASIRTTISFKLSSFFLDIVAITLTINMIIIVNKNQYPIKLQTQEDSKLQTQTWENYSTDYLSNLSPTKTFNGDVYYLVFDDFASQTTLENNYNYSGVNLFQKLSEKGFRVIDDGRSNYNQTVYSIPSALNFSYIQQFSNISIQKEIEGSLTNVLIKDGLVFNFFRNQGYKVVTFSTGIYYIDVDTSDLYLSPPGVPSFFTGELVNNSVLALFYWKQQYLWNCTRIEFTFNQLADINKIDSPIFVYAHIMLPHPPFVYKKDGLVEIPFKKFDYRDNNAFTELDTREIYINGYRDQVEYASHQLLQIVDSIQKISPDSIIIIQGDHGPGAYYEQEDLENSNLDEKAHRLNAYYFPDGITHKCDDITPVNTFRVLPINILGLIWTYYLITRIFPRIPIQWNLLMSPRV